MLCLKDKLLDKVFLQHGKTEKISSWLHDCNIFYSLIVLNRNSGFEAAEGHCNRVIATQPQFDIWVTFPISGL